MILVTYAMPEEAPRLQVPDHVQLVQTGIGKVLAATQLARAVSQAEPVEMVVSVGFCGGLNGTEQGTLVMPDTTCQWDLWLDHLDIPLGHGYAMQCPLALPQVELNAVPKPRRGLMITGDRFVDRTVHIHDRAVAVDMETAALALVCAEFGIPFVSVREVSDVADGPQGMPHQQFMDYIREKGPDYSSAVLELAERGAAGIGPVRKVPQVGTEAPGHKNPASL